VFFSVLASERRKHTQTPTAQELGDVNKKEDKHTTTAAAATQKAQNTERHNITKQTKKMARQQQKNG
jgi:hypothetical protein